MYMLLCYNRRPTATPNVSLFRFIFFCPSFQCFATGFAPLLQFCKHHIFFNTVVDDFDNFGVDVRFDFSHSFNLGQDSFARIGTSTTSHAYFKFGRHCQGSGRRFGLCPKMCDAGIENPKKNVWLNKSINPLNKTFLLGRPKTHFLRKRQNPKKNVFILGQRLIEDFGLGPGTGTTWSPHKLNFEREQ
jgi:hypothetical protein